MWASPVTSAMLPYLRVLPTMTWSASPFQSTALSPPGTEDAISIGKAAEGQLLRRRERNGRLTDPLLERRGDPAHDRGIDAQARHEEEMMPAA